MPSPGPPNARSMSRARRISAGPTGRPPSHPRRDPRRPTNPRPRSPVSRVRTPSPRPPPRRPLEREVLRKPGPLHRGRERERPPSERGNPQPRRAGRAQGETCLPVAGSAGVAPLHLPYRLILLLGRARLLPSRFRNCAGLSGSFALPKVVGQVEPVARPAARLHARPVPPRGTRPATRVPASHTAASRIRT